MDYIEANHMHHIDLNELVFESDKEPSHTYYKKQSNPRKSFPETWIWLDETTK